MFRPHPTSWRPECKRLKECSLLQLLRLIRSSVCTVRLCTSLLLGLEHTRFSNEAHTATSSRPFELTGNYTPAILSLQIADYKSRNSSASIHVNHFFFKKQSFSLSSACPLFCVVCVYVCPLYSQRHLSHWFHILVILTNHPLQSVEDLQRKDWGPWRARNSVSRPPFQLILQQQLLLEFPTCLFSLEV